MENDIEIRINRLEKQLKRQKLTTLTLLIGALLAVGATRVVSQNEAREMTLRTLKIVGKDGRVKLLLGGDTLGQDGGALALFDNKGSARLGLVASDQGGSVSILRQDGEPMAILGFSGDGGSLGLFNNGTKTQVNIAATREASGLVMSGPNGKKQLVAGADASGGVVQLFESGGKLKQQLP